MSLKDNIIASYKHIPYTWNHKMEVIRLEKKFTGKNSLRILLHDADKLVGYVLFPFLTLHQHKTIHRKLNSHHNYASIANLSNATLREIVLDWESAHYTKPDKQQTAREWCYMHRPSCYPYLEKYFKEWNL